MTVSSIVPVNNYTGNSSVVNFDFDFLIEKEDELVVQHTDANGITSILQYNVDYSIKEIGNKNGSYITFPLNGSSYKVLGTDEHISLALSLQIEQESEFHNSSYFNLNILEWTFDYIVRILQILSRKIDRCVKVEEPATVSPDDIMEELNNKCEKVHSAHSEIVDLSKEMELYKDLAVDSFNNAQKEANLAKEQAELATDKADIATEQANIAIEQAKQATINAKEAGLIIGQSIALYCTKDYVPAGCLPCDGGEYTKTQFSNLWDNYLASSTIRLNTCTYTEYQKDIANYGQCAKFAVDTTNEKFKVPLMKDGAVTQQALSDSELGKCYKERLLSTTSDDTVQMNTIALRHFVVVSNGQLNQSTMDWSNWASSLQGKLNADLSNFPKPYITETYVNGSSWYRVWSDGWCEQGGYYTSDGTSDVTINLLKSYKNTHYSLLLTMKRTSSRDSLTTPTNGFYLKTTSSFSKYCATSAAYEAGFNWETKGYIK